MHWMLVRQTSGDNLSIFVVLSSDIYGFSPAEKLLRLNKGLTVEASAKVEIMIHTEKNPKIF